MGKVCVIFLLVIIGTPGNINCDSSDDSRSSIEDESSNEHEWNINCDFSDDSRNSIEDESSNEQEWCYSDLCRETVEILDSEAEEASDIVESGSERSKLFRVLSSRQHIKDLSRFALSEHLALKKCRQRHLGLSCEEFLESLDEGEICRKRRRSCHFCPITVPKCLSETKNYRTINGTCNNNEHSLIGSAGRAFQRFLPPEYFDCIGEPRDVPGGLPSARAVSNSIHQSDMLPKSNVATFLIVTYGQTIDHDINLTPVSKLRNKSTGKLVDVDCGISNCETDGHAKRNCFPIAVPPDDPLFEENQCLLFVRSDKVPTDDCSPSPRQQPNDITSWLDASFVYDSENEAADFLRTRYDGKLKSMPHPFNPNFLPLLPPQEDSECRGTDEAIKCFLAGDRRQNEHVGLMAVHTMFMRYHNYIAHNLKRQHPFWSDEKLYQVSRHILIAVWQMTIYNEYLPVILGQDFMDAFELNPRTTGYFEDYNADIEEVNPDTANGFATAAYRFGHSQIASKIRFSDPTLQHQEDVFLSEVFFDPRRIYKSGIRGDSISGIAAVVIGHTNQEASRLDAILSPQITGRLFTNMPPFGRGADLAALNIQRGRDHGIPSYTKWRSWCNEEFDENELKSYKMKRPSSFADLNDTINKFKIEKLKSLYRHVDNVDLFTAGLLESHVRGGLVGPTFACIIAKNFHNKKFGDRFYFETNNRAIRFTTEQLKNIREQTIASILCKTLEDDPGNPDLELKFQRRVLLQPYDDAVKAMNAADISEEERRAKLALYNGEANNRLPCSQHPQLNFDLF